MYRQFGGSALLLLLITSAISHVAGPSRSAVAVRGGSGGQSSSAVETSAVQADQHKCYIFEALRRYAGVLESSGNGNGSEEPASASPLICSSSKFASIFPSGIPQVSAKDSQVLIATVPDPLQSSEALQFDRDIAALQEAASTAGYDFQRMTTPWQVSDLTEPKDLKDAREVDRYRERFGDEPGVILFRKRTRVDKVRLEEPDSLLLLVLVPESPIYGLNLAAGREALGAVSTLLNHGFRTTQTEETDGVSRIRWIGPSYSASAPGLRTLEQESQPHVLFDVLSGTVSTNSANAFLTRLNQDGRAVPSARDKKATLTESDQDSLCWFLGQTLRPGMHTDEPVVVLQEDETAYGGNISDPTALSNPCSPLTNYVRRFTFPRGISHVRRVYGNTLKNAASNQQQDESSTSNTNVALSFRDELEDPIDSVPEFALQSPISNESVLAAIATSIKHLHARAIVIRTSDPMDQLFLARYFRQACPDSRLVLFNAERLLTRLRGDFDLDGTLVVSRFPLFQNAYLQTPFRGESRHSLTFTNSREEAIFLAALLQIKAGHLPIFQSPFAHERYAMAPWIGVASGGDFWPVAYLGKDLASGELKTSDNVLLLTDTPPERLPVLWTLVTLAVLAIAVIHFLLFLAALPLHSKLKHSSKAWARRIAHHKMLSFYLMPVSPASCEQSRLFTGQCWWLLNVSTQLVLMLAYLLFPVIAYQSKVQNITSVPAAIMNFPIQTTFFAGFTLIVLMLQFCMAGTLFLLLSKRCRQLGRGFFVRFEGFLLPCMSFLWLVLSLGLFCLQLADRQTGFAFASRSLHLTSGACPILPLLLVSLGFMIAAVVNLNALSMAVTRNPGLPLIHWPYLDLASWQIRLAGYTELWYGLPGADGELLALIVILACFLLHPQRLFATFDTPYIGWLYTCNFVLSIWTVLWLWARFTRIWVVLRGGLDSLEGSPLRFAFSRLPLTFSIDPIWSYSGLRRLVTLPMRWFEYLRVAPPVADEKEAILADNLNELRTILQEMRDAQWLDSKSYTNFSHKQNQYAIRLSEVPAIRVSWERGGPDCSVSGSACKVEKSEEGEAKESANAGCPQSRADLPSPCGTVFGQDNCLVELGNEFIAMRIAAYVRYITLQMKNLMTFMSLGFLLSLLASISYPFDRPQIIAWSATLTLAALLFTVGTALAQMDRDAILSRMSNSTPGQVRYMAFVKHMLAVGGLPIVTLLATLFPAIGSYLFSWAAPIMESLH